MSKDDGSDAAKTRRQVDNAVCWLQKRYFTEEVIAKRFNESAAPLFKVNKNDRNSQRRFYFWHALIPHVSIAILLIDRTFIVSTR